MDFAKCIFIFLSNEKLRQETFTVSLEILTIYRKHPSLKYLPINGQPVITGLMPRPLVTAYYVSGECIKRKVEKLPQNAVLHSYSPCCCWVTCQRLNTTAT